MIDLSMAALVSSIADARNQAGIALLPFVPAAYPNLDVTIEILRSLDAPGIGAIEVGFPFSDPIADGPTIQEAFADALAGGFKVGELFARLGAVKHDLTKPLVAMVSYSIAFRYGLPRFLRDAKEAGFRGILFPDVPPPEAQSICEQIASAGLESVLLVAPTTTPKRREAIAKLSTGFVYYLSVAGITGERTSLPSDLEDNVRKLKALSSVPVCVGFGVSTSEHVKQLKGVSDGAIVGSALVKQIKQHASETPIQIAQAVKSYCAQLLAR
jgi:tryptophan synthase alpha chain